MYKIVLTLLLIGKFKLIIEYTFRATHLRIVAVWLLASLSAISEVFFLALALLSDQYKAKLKSELHCTSVLAYYVYFPLFLHSNWIYMNYLLPNGIIF